MEKVDTAKLRELAEKVALDARIGEAGRTAADWPIKHDEAGKLAAAVLALLDDNARLRHENGQIRGLLYEAIDEAEAQIDPPHEPYKQEPLEIRGNDRRRVYAWVRKARAALSGGAR